MNHQKNRSKGVVEKTLNSVSTVSDSVSNAVPSSGLRPSLLGRPSLLDSRFDRDACGVGFVASVDTVPSHTILTQALTALARLAHRGATAVDGRSSDGVGV